jgi:hypothetical protein
VKRCICCREAYKALDVRSDRVTSGLQLAKSHLRQLLQDVAMVDPGTGHSDALLSHGAIGPGLCLDLSTRDSWSSASPLVCSGFFLLLARALSTSIRVTLTLLLRLFSCLYERSVGSEVTRKFVPCLLL